MKKIIVFIFLLACISCSTKSKHQELSTRAEQFKKAVYWGMVPEALSLVDEESKTAMKRELLRRTRSEKTVDMEIEDISFEEGGDTAVVTVITRYYQSPTYTVLERREEQNWSYNMFDQGWTLTSSEAISEPSPTTLPAIR